MNKDDLITKLKVKFKNHTNKEADEKEVPNLITDTNLMMEVLKDELDDLNLRLKKVEDKVK